MIKLVIFDLDGTLVNAYPAVVKSVNYTLVSMGRAPRSFDEIKRSVGGGDRQLMAHFVGEELKDKALKIYRAHHAQALQSGIIKILPGALSTLKYLKSHGYKLAIASNRPDKFTRIILKVLGLADYFDRVLCADKAPRPKPYPDMLLIIAKRLKIAKNEIFYVGDMDIDIQCGHQAGVRTVAVATGSCLKKELKALKPFAVMDKMNQLKLIISAKGGSASG